MSKHTPGPWEVFKEHNIRQVKTQRGVANCGGYAQNWDEDIVYIENLANGVLIAAAPELLEALRAAEWHGNVEYIALPKATCPCCGNTRQQNHRSDCILSAAIKKAEGKS